MSALALTRGQIISAGLALAGREDLVSDARLWLNLFLEKQYFNQDFEWLVKTLTGQSITDALAFPPDYRSAKSATLVSIAGTGRIPIQVLSDHAHWDYRKSVTHNVEGAPNYIFADHDLRKFYFVPATSSLYTWDLKYFHIPDLPDYTDAGTDSETVKWGLPVEILIDHIKSRALEYDDDTRQDAAKQSVKMDLAEAKMNNHDRRAGPSRLAMGKRFRRRFE